MQGFTQAVTVKSVLSQLTMQSIKYQVNPLQGAINLLTVGAGLAGLTGANSDQQMLTKAGGFLKGLGSDPVYQEQTRNTLSTTHENTVNVSLTFGSGNQSNAQLGPGAGDKVIFLRDVVFAWAGVDDKFVLSPVAYRREVVTTVAGLHAEPFGNNPPSPTALASLLVLDPQADYPTLATIDPARFVSCQEISNEDSPPSEQTARYEYQESDLQAESSSATTITQDNADPLAKFMGVTTDSVKESTVTYGTSVQQSQTQVVEAHFSIPGHTLAEFCYDVLFGSFLIRKIQPAITPLLSGIWKDERGSPVRYGEIMLLVNGVPITTITNAQGRFVLRSPRVQPGVHVLLLAGTQRTVRLGTEPVRNLVLVAHPRPTDLHPRTR